MNEMVGGESVYMKMYNARKYNKMNTLRHIIDEIHEPCEAEKERLTKILAYDDPSRNETLDSNSWDHITHNTGYKELFQLITGLNPNLPDTMNAKMACTVHRQQKNDDGTTQVMIDLDCGQSARMTELDGFNVEASEYHKDGISSIDDLVQGQVFIAWVKQIKFETMSFYMSRNQSDVEKWKRATRRPSPDDLYFIEPATAKESFSSSSSSGSQSSVSKAVRPLNKRTIYEECFHNVSRENAIELLKQEDIGSVVFRPSSKGNTRINATLKFYEDIYSDYIIEEEDKDKTDENTLKNLGGILYVGTRNAKEAKGTEYSSLEEIQFRHFNEVMENAESIVNHRKFLKGGRRIVESQCHEEIGSNPTRCAYHFGISHNHPGFFELGYITTKTFRYIYVQPDVEGIRCAGKLYVGDDALTQLMIEFKKAPHNMYKKAQHAKQEYAEEKRREAAAKKKLEDEEKQRWQEQQNHTAPQVYNAAYYQPPANSGYQYQPPQQQPQYGYGGTVGVPAPGAGGYYGGQPQQPPPPAPPLSYQQYAHGGPPPPQQRGGQDQYYHPPAGQGGY